ncbi:hypothetical protein M3181_15950 [Mesobacillus maritimus]|uniref:hypothetical protein n=1 Tax=Mesobacillus maritimus TaxID=1643336 RepID=UPI002042254B|nr:hypothetical protein [Mesobacillus maritimus]MCM3670459.1 hypothetical protein [Mesobacillus maritimus]
MKSVKQRLHHLIDEMNEQEAESLYENVNDLKSSKIKNQSKQNHEKLEWDPAVDDEVWQYVC